MKLIPTVPWNYEPKPLPVEERLYATFKGRNSLGYVRGKTYCLLLWRQLFKGKECLWIRRSDGTGICPYSSYEKFEENWDIV